MRPKRFGVCVLLACLVGLLAIVGQADALGRLRNGRGYEAPQTAQAQKLPAERVTMLPEDGGGIVATICVHEDWQSRPEEAELVEAWRELPEVQEAAAGGRLVTYGERDPLYQSRLKQYCPQLPALLVTKASGEVLVKDHGEATVAAVDADGGLPARREANFSWTHKRGEQPAPCPCPQPVKTNVDVVVNRPLPDKVKPKGEDAGGIALLVGLVALAGAVAVGGAVVYNFRAKANQAAGG